MSSKKDNKVKEYDFLELLKILIDRKYSVIILMFIFLACGFALTKILPGVYQATFNYEIGGYKTLTKLDSLSFGYNQIESPSSFTDRATIRFSSSDYEVEEIMPVGDKFVKFTVYSSSPENAKKDSESIANILNNEHKLMLDKYLIGKRNEINQLRNKISVIKKALNSEEAQELALVNGSNTLLKTLLDMEYNLFLQEKSIDDSGYKYSSVFGPIIVLNEKVKPKDWFVISLSLIFGFLFSSLYAFVSDAYDAKEKSN